MVIKSDKQCEDFFKINEIVCLQKKKMNSIDALVALLCSVFFYKFPMCKSDIHYEKCNLNEATHFGIFAADKSYSIVEAYEVSLPKIPATSNIFLYFKSNVVSYMTKCFKYKNFTYAYSPISKSFEAIVFELNASLDVLSRKFLNGLTEKEANYQHLLYGPCELDIKISSYLALIQQEFKNPFFLFQIFAILFWISEDYKIYAILILSATIYFVFMSIVEIRTNLLKINKVTNIESELIIYRNEVKILNKFFFILFLSLIRLIKYHRT